MQINLTFNTPEDHGLNLRGTVKFASDFDVGGISELHIRGLGAWRNVPEQIIHVNKNVLENLVKNRLKGKPVTVIGLKANSDILLSAAIRDKGEAEVIKLLNKFFKALSSQAAVDIKNADEYDEDNEQ